MSVKINRNFEVFSPTDFLAAITQHIPDKGVQMVRYYGWYSNKMRGGRQPAFSKKTASNPLRPNIIPPPPRRLPSKKWRDIIMQVWHTDPLRCPVCQNIMRVVDHHQRAFQALRCLNPEPRTRSCKARRKNRKKASFPPASVYIRWQ